MNMRIILWKEILFVAILTLFLHLVSLKFFLYWTIWWFDIPLHFLGGFLIGLIAISFLKIINRNTFVTFNLFFLTIFAVMIVGLVWELWEIFIGFTDVLKDKGDTILDLIMDFLGGIFSVLYYYLKYSK